MTKNIFLAILVIGFSSFTSTEKSFAHGGEDHDTPMTMNAPKGGVVKALEKTNVEVVSKGKDIFIYLYDKAMKPKSVSGFVVSAKAEIPRSKKQDDIKLTPKETSFDASYDAKGIHRYTLLVVIKDPGTGHDDKLKYTIEPKK